MGIKGVGPLGGASLVKSLLSTPPPPPRAGTLFVPAQKLSLIEWVYSLSSDTLRYGFSLLKSKYWSFVYLQLCLSGSRTGWFYYTVSAPLSVIRGMNTPYNPKRRKPKKEAYYFVLFCSVSFNLFLYVLFFSHQDSPTHRIFDRYNDTTHPWRVK